MILLVNKVFARVCMGFRYIFVCVCACPDYYTISYNNKNYSPILYIYSSVFMCVCVCRSLWRLPYGNGRNINKCVPTNGSFEFSFPFAKLKYSSLHKDIYIFFDTYTLLQR